MQTDPIDLLDLRDLGARLRAARSAGGWTQERAAEEIGAARTTMVAIEKGERRIRPDELVRLASLYGRGLSHFLRSGAPAEDLSVRLRNALPPEVAGDPDLLSAIGQIERLCDDAVELERLCGVPKIRREPPLYPLDGVDPEEAAEDVATAERNRLGLGDAPLLDLRAVLEEEVGLRVFYLDLPSEVSGLFVYGEGYGGVMAINRSHSAERRRRALAHEYGHLLTDRFRAEVTLAGRYERRPAGERFAEAFARALLMPAASVRRRFHELVRQRGRRVESDRAGGATAGDLIHLAHGFFVSAEAMTRRLEELGLVASGTWEDLRRRGFRIGDTRRLMGLRERPAEEEPLPARFRFLAVEAWQRGEISEGQLAAFLRVDRLAARRMVREIGLRMDDDSGAGGASLDLSAPLAAGAG
jgi:Zn-dependent peptidase ImmA (M78 family)/DNA-binding XRE family transcriptional regulator